MTGSRRARLVAATAVVLLLAACGDPTIAAQDSAGVSPTPTPSGIPTDEPAQSQTATDRTIAIYAAVVGGQFPPENGRRVIYLFHAPAGRADRMDETKPGKPFDSRVRAGLRKAFPDG